MDDEDNLALEEELFGTGAHAQDGHHDRDEGKTVDYLQFEPTTSHRTRNTLSESTANEGKDASSSAEPGPLPIPPQRSMSVSLQPSMTNQKGPSLAAAVIHEWHTSCFMSARQALAAHTQERLQKSMGGRGSESDIRMAAALRTEELRLLHLAEQERERSDAERVTRAIESIRTGGKGGPTEHPLTELFAPLLASSASVALEGWEVILLSVLDSNAHTCEAKALLLTPYMEALLRIPPQLLSKDTSFTHHPSSLPGVDRHPLGAAMTRFLLVFESLYYTHTHVHTHTHAHTHSGEGNGKSTGTTGAVKGAERDGDKRQAGPAGGGSSSSGGGGGGDGKGDARGTAAKQATIASTATLKAAAHNLTQRHSPGHTRQPSGGERDLSAHYVEPRADVEIGDMTTDVCAFVKLVRISLKRLFPRIAETQEHLNLLQEVADRTIFKLLPQPLQVLIHVRRTDEEMLLERLTRMLASEQGEEGPENSIAVRHLNVSADYRLDGSGAEGPVQPSQNYTERSRASYAPAISELLSMSLCTYSVDKARHLAAAFRLIPRCVAQYYETQPASASPDSPTPTHTDTHTPPQPLSDVVDAMASDDLLPVLELLVVLCYTHTHAHGCAMPLRDLPAHLEYIDRLLPDNFKDSEEGYCVVSLTAAVADLMEGVKYD